MSTVKPYYKAQGFYLLTLFMAAATLSAPAPQVAVATQTLPQAVDRWNMSVIDTAFGDAKEPPDDFFSNTGTLVFSPCFSATSAQHFFTTTT